MKKQAYNILQDAIDNYPLDDAASEAEWFNDWGLDCTPDEERSSLEKIRAHWIKVFDGEPDAAELMRRFVAKFNELSVGLKL